MMALARSGLVGRCGKLETIDKDVPNSLAPSANTSDTHPLPGLIVQHLQGQLVSWKLQ